MPTVSLALELGHLLPESNVLHGDPHDLSHRRGGRVQGHVDGGRLQLRRRLLPGGQQDQRRLLDLGWIGQTFRLEAGRVEPCQLAAVQHVEVKPGGGFHERPLI